MADRGPILILGGAGFIGRALAARLAGRGLPVTAIMRNSVSLGPGIEVRALGALSANTDWPALVGGTRAVVHLASRAHAPAAGEDWIAAEAAMASALARAAMAAGVSRLVLMSSIKVLGDDSATPLRATDPPAPADAYGRAKERIEDAMRDAGSALVVIRPPLVYGPGVKANFRALLRLVDSGLPLPLASIANRRSFVFIDNLLDLVELALTHELASGVFLLRDEEEISTPALIRLIARALDRPARLFPCPPELLRRAAALIGKRDAAARLLGSLRIDDGATRASLGWRPRVTLSDGIAATCRWYRANA